MVLSYGDVSQLKGQPWFMLECSNRTTIEQTLRRVGNQIPGIFKGDAIEIFAPVERRDLDHFDLSTDLYIFARATRIHPLLRLKTITGIVALVCQGDANHYSAAIQTPDDYVQKLIKQCEQQFYGRATGLTIGSFVRIIDGQTRDYCGHVMAMRNGWATVQVNLITKSVIVETPVRNLLKVDAPMSEQVFFYCPSVAELPDKSLLSIPYEEEPSLRKSLEEIQEPTSCATGDKLRSRQCMPTATIRRLIADGESDPFVIAQVVVPAILVGDLKAPKNWFIVYCLIKDHLFKRYYKPRFPHMDSWRDVVHIKELPWHGKRFNPQAVAKLDKKSVIPVFTINPVKDGRSREARIAKKARLEAERLSKKRKSPGESNSKPA